MASKKIEKELFTKALGKRINQLREEKKMSLIDVAYNLQIETNSLRRYERGETLMNSYYLVQLAHILDVSINKLTKGLFNTDEENK